MAKITKTNDDFGKNLIFFKFFMDLIVNVDSFDGKGKLETFRDNDNIGIDGKNTKFYKKIIEGDHEVNVKAKYPTLKLDLNEYDKNIVGYFNQLKTDKRPNLENLEYFQYLSLLFTEIYLDNYFNKTVEFIKVLNEFKTKLAEKDKDIQKNISDWTADDMNKLCFMCATGSGKTLLMHINYWQFEHYNTGSKKMDINHNLLITPNERMTTQHIKELDLSGIECKEYDGKTENDKGIEILDNHKLTYNDGNKKARKETQKGDGKVTDVSEFEKNNLIFVDEGHRGTSGEKWIESRKYLAENGFTFEYSATFRQAINSAPKDKKKELLNEYGKSIIMDYSYKFFNEDGYGKKPSIVNLGSDTKLTPEMQKLYLTKCLLSFYQQMKIYKDKESEIAEYYIEKPLLVFVGNTVNKTKEEEELAQSETNKKKFEKKLKETPEKNTEQRNELQKEIDELQEKISGLQGSKQTEEQKLFSDVDEVLNFLNDFCKNVSNETIKNIQTIINEKNEKFKYIEDNKNIYKDILEIVFNTTNTTTPEIKLKKLTKIDGEIGLYIDDNDSFFGVINIGDVDKFLKRANSTYTVSDADITDSLFTDITENKKSKVNILIGSKKFAEGWDCFRVSSMGLINFGQGEGSQAIQLFGRGVRLHGYKNRMKRADPKKISRDDKKEHPIEYLKYLETLNIFGVRAGYMEIFAKLIEEGTGKNISEKTEEFKLKIHKRFNEGIPSFANGNELKITTTGTTEDFVIGKTISLKLEDIKTEKEKSEKGIKKIVVDNRLYTSEIKEVEKDGKITTEVCKTFIDGQTVIFDEKIKIDFERVFVELHGYKIAQGYSNILFGMNILRTIMENNTWYELTTSKEKQDYTELAIELLKNYLGHFFNYHFRQWLIGKTTYVPLKKEHPNFFDEYTISVKYKDSDTTQRDEIEKFKKKITSILDEIKKRKKTKFSPYQENSNAKVDESFIAFDFEEHLYIPLLTLGNGKDCENITISPVGLVKSEKMFMDKLEEYYQREKNGKLKDKKLYILRNQSQKGVGFYLDSGACYYPDFIMWIIDESKDTKNEQYVTFIDPKGLLNVAGYDEKIEFAEEIKKLPTPSGIKLNSFIVTESDIDKKWDKDKVKNGEKMNELNVYHLEYSKNAGENGINCIEAIIEKVLSS